MSDAIPSVLSGTLRTLANGDIEAELRDAFGYLTRISGVPTGEPGVWSIGAVVEVPAGLAIAFLDDEAAL